MGGEGSIQSMISSLRYNRSLRRKKNPFKENQKSTFLENHKLRNKKATKTQLDEVRAKIVEHKRKEQKRMFLIILFSIFFTSILVYLFVLLINNVVIG